MAEEGKKQFFNGGVGPASQLSPAGIETTSCRPGEVSDGVFVKKKKPRQKNIKGKNIKDQKLDSTKDWLVVPSQVNIGIVAWTAAPRHTPLPEPSPVAHSTAQNSWYVSHP
jgi:hypothetical protein